MVGLLSRDDGCICDQRRKQRIYIGSHLCGVYLPKEGGGLGFELKPIIVRKRNYLNNSILIIKQ